MTAARAAAALFGGVALLERAVGYALGQLQAVTPAVLSRATPCPGWDLRVLLEHMEDSLAAMQEALVLKHVDVDGPPGGGAVGAGAEGAAVAGEAAGGREAASGREAAGGREAADGRDMVAALRGRARQLLGALAGADENLVWVGGYPVPVRIVASAGAIDVAVHGWDVGRACGTGEPIPGDLALNLLRIAPLLVSDADRPTRFAEPVTVEPDASPGDRLLAYLGRDPHWHIHHPGAHPPVARG
jgi:uncharacterized protein (TIGR03086 family)